MARVKQSVVQRDFSLQEIRPDFLDAKTEEMRARSLRGALNMRGMTTKTTQARPGTYHVSRFGGAVSIHEIRPADGKTFAVVIRNGGIDIIDRFGTGVASFNRPAWGDGTDLWIESARERTLIGHPTAGIHVLAYEDGNWSLNAWVFSSAEGGELAQPYWSFAKNISIKPSGRNNTVTITASKAVFSPAFVGQRIRYLYREIHINRYVSPTTVVGRVITSLPPSYELTVTNSNEFRLGDILIGADTNWQGMLVQKLANNVIRVATLAFFNGPDINENIVGPSETSSTSTSTGGPKVTAKREIAPLPTTIWEEPLMSPHRGFPRSCSAISGRLVFVDFPQVPDMIALSSARDIQDFKVGAADDDAIIRQEGDGSPRFLHAINAGDLLLLSDRGCYYVPIRDNGVLTPASFNAVFFDQRGASTVRPVKVDDGVVFVESNGETISAALLEGNGYLKWSVRALTLFHHQLIKTPVGLCGPAIGSKEAEKYVFVVNEDGTLAAMAWSMKLGEESVGFSPWETDGKFKHVSPVFGDYWTLVDRVSNATTYRYIERFDYGSYVDAGVDQGLASFATNLTVNGDTLMVNGQPLQVRQPGATHLAGRNVAVMSGPHFAGMTSASSTGAIDDLGVSTDRIQVGLPFIAKAGIWPVELVDSPRIGMVTVRVIEMSVSVMETTAFQIVCNGETRTVGGYSAGDLFSNPPPLHTKVFRAPVMGRRDHPDLEVVKHIPGPFRILSVGQEVQG